MIRTRVLEWWESKTANAEVTPQAIQTIAKLLINRNGPSAPTAIHDPLGIKFNLLDKANTIADCLEKKFTPHDLCEENHKQKVEAKSPRSAQSCRQQLP
jgi:hypothetical protein